MARWLVKSEPDVYSIDDLKAQKVTTWEGVRNYQARNYLRSMAKGDEVLFYHSNCDEPGVVGIATVARTAYPDHTQFDPAHKYFDPASNPADPRWSLVDVRFKRKLKRTVTLAELKARAGELGDFALVRKGNRLSVIPVSDAQWDTITALEAGR